MSQHIKDQLLEIAKKTAQGYHDIRDMLNDFTYKLE